jgi:hypothetical protein
MQYMQDKHIETSFTAASCTGGRSSVTDNGEVSELCIVARSKTRVVFGFLELCVAFSVADVELRFDDVQLAFR